MTVVALVVCGGSFFPASFGRLIRFAPRQASLHFSALHKTHPAKESQRHFAQACVLMHVNNLSFAQPRESAEWRREPADRCLWELAFHIIAVCSALELQLKCRLKSFKLQMLGIFLTKILFQGLQFHSERGKFYACLGSVFRHCVCPAATISN
jgi:hypothetical protein